MVWYGMVWYGVVWYGMVWYDMVWYGMTWYGMVCDSIVVSYPYSLLPSFDHFYERLYASQTEVLEVILLVQHLCSLPSHCGLESQS